MSNNGISWRSGPNDSLYQPSQDEHRGSNHLIKSGFVTAPQIQPSQVLHVIDPGTKPYLTTPVEGVKGIASDQTQWLDFRKQATFPPSEVVPKDSLPGLNGKLLPSSSAATTILGDVRTNSDGGFHSKSSPKDEQVQYTIIITDPRIVNSSRQDVGNASTTSNILLAGLAQQNSLQQYQQQQILKNHNEQQRYQIHPVVPETTNTFNTNHNSKSFNRLESTALVQPSVSNATYKDVDERSFESPVNGLSNTNTKLSSAILNADGNIVIVNYGDQQLNCLDLYNKSQETQILDFHNIKQNINGNQSHSKDVDEELSILDCNGQSILDTRRVSVNSIKCLPSRDQLGDACSPTSKSIEGMHSGRAGSEATHPTQQHRISPLAAGAHNTAHTSALSVDPSVATSHQSHQPNMLSAGQPALSSGLFRSGTDIPSSTHRLAGAAGSSYLPSQYSTIYGVHNQNPSHISPTLQPYNAAFLPPQFAGTAGSATHGFSHSPLLATSSSGHYHQFESYSAMLASMGSHVQQRATQGSDLNRSPRVAGPGTPGAGVQSQPGSYMSHSASGSYTTASSTSSSRQCLSGSSSPNPSPTTAANNSVPGLSSRLVPVSSLHLEKMPSRKSVTHERRNDQDSIRNPRIYDAAGILEKQHSQSIAGSYSMGEHVQKVSFDSVVKEYGGRNSPSGQDFFRSHLSGKEGSLKHRILIRPSDTDDESDKASCGQELKEEPALKRFKSSQPGLPNCQIEEILSPNHHYSIAYTDRPLVASSSLSEGAHNKLRSNPSFINDKTNQSLAFQQSKETIPSVPLSPHYYHSAETQDLDKDHDKLTYCSTSAVQPEAAPINPSINTSPGGSHLQYPMHFMKGSIIQLADGSLKRVEELQTDDFISSAEISADLKVDSSTVERIEEHLDKGTAMLSFSVGEHKVQVTVEATLEHPFFVFQRGWSSCSVSRTLARYGLDCQKLCVGDVCISLTQKDVDLKAAEPSQQQLEQRSTSSPVSQSSAMTTTASVKPEKVDTTALFSSAASTSSSSPSFPLAQSVRKRISQADLPPPLTNIVPVKKENNNLQFVRGLGSHNGDSQSKDKKYEKEEEDDLKSLHQKRLWPTQDHTSFKVGSEMERKLRAKEVSKTDENVEDNSR